MPSSLAALQITLRICPLPLCPCHLPSTPRLELAVQVCSSPGPQSPPRPLTSPLRSLQSSSISSALSSSDTSPSSASSLMLAGSFLPWGRRWTLAGALWEVLGGRHPQELQQSVGAFPKLACGSQAGGRASPPILAAAAWEGRARV